MAVHKSRVKKSTSHTGVKKHPLSVENPVTVEAMYDLIEKEREDKTIEERIPYRLAAWVISGVKLIRAEGSWLPSLSTSRERREVLDCEIITIQQILSESVVENKNLKLMENARGLVIKYDKIMEGRRKSRRAAMAKMASSFGAPLIRGRSHASMAGSEDWRQVGEGDFEIELAERFWGSVPVGGPELAGMPQKMAVHEEITGRAFQVVENEIDAATGPRFKLLRRESNILQHEDVRNAAYHIGEESRSLDFIIGSQGSLKHQVAMKKAVESMRLDDLKKAEQEMDKFLRNNPSVAQSLAGLIIRRWDSIADYERKEEGARKEERKRWQQKKQRDEQTSLREQVEEAQWLARMPGTFRKVPGLIGVEVDTTSHEYGAREFITGLAHYLESLLEQKL